MDYEEQPTHKRSLGALKKAEKTKPRSPDCTGPIKLQRHTIETFNKQFEQTASDEITANLAGWRNGPYLNVELSPKFVAKEKTTKKSDPDVFFDNDDEDGQH
jgi:hypothetical protein